MQHSAHAGRQAGGAAIRPRGRLGHYSQRHDACAGKTRGQGLVQRVRGKSKDGRAAMVSITPAGREVRRRIDQLMLERTQKIVSAIPAGWRPQLLAALRVLNQSMGPEGCCEFNGEWPEVAVSCKVMDRKKPATRRNTNVRQ